MSFGEEEGRNTVGIQRDRKCADLSTVATWSKVIYKGTLYFIPIRVKMGWQEGGYSEYQPVGAIKRRALKPSYNNPSPNHLLQK